MKIIVFGASGGTGQHIIDTALRHGHHVTAITRRPDAVPDPTRPALSVAHADIRDAESLPAVIAGHDAVISAIGIRRGKPRRLYSQGTANIVNAMQLSDVSRLLCVSSGGVDPTDRGLPWWYRRLLIPLALRELYQDMAIMETTVRASGLEWTLIRASSLNDRAPQGDLQVLDGRQPPGLWRLTRADLADFLVDEAENNRWVHRIPTVAQ
ncbi:NAD(P)-dependent oxidoreductase [Streptosporangium sp. 'caverna']|uniref:NAD(P)-dependent oxidoreductase n=1 Tax=Streptosporangium sp. 'caverna' TaxID=2202249 RepID=UPI0013A6BC8C|nr:SDR family oxidoreductase [Streptosporangium sp. 'caverna']